MPRTRRKTSTTLLTRADDPHWYRDAVIYEVHVRAFRDSDGDGMGDFRGLTERLGYLRDLGVTALWLLPFYPSPWKDDGYDIADYCNIHPAYGTIRDFQAFLREAHKRGLRVITELVINHTSDQHPWFQRARHAPPGSREREFYVWSDTPDRYSDARIIFKDFETSNWTWDPVARAYYWHRFYSHQPDLNFDQPAVRSAVLRAMEFWLEMGVDGMRLDAVPYLYERDGTSCENLPETHAFLKQLRKHVDRKYRNRMLLAEANQWPEDAVHYFGDGDECHMAFHFPVMPRLFMAIHMEDRFPIVEIMEQTPEIPASCQWALFLRNHDELTLEMVTDAERDYMYRAYASDAHAKINLGIRRRLAPLLGNSRRRIELMNSLLFSLPGTPVLYYGDEIGMGDNIFLGDRNGVRTPLHWSWDRNAGFSSANPQRLYLPIITDPEYHYEANNIEAQQANHNSLLWWTKRLIALRKRYRVFGRGTMDFLHPSNEKVLAFLRRHEQQVVLVVANLSRFAQSVELDLSEFRGRVPIELFGTSRFLPIRDEPYVLTLGPHAFFWFALQDAEAMALRPRAGGERAVPTLSVEHDWREVFSPAQRAALQDALAGYLLGASWFDLGGRSVQSLDVLDTAEISQGRLEASLVLARVIFNEGEPEEYAFYLAKLSGDEAGRFAQEQPAALIARVDASHDGTQSLVIDALYHGEFVFELLAVVARRRIWKASRARVEGLRTRVLRTRLDAAVGKTAARTLNANRSPASLLVRDESGNDLFFIKCFRRIEPGAHPEVELSRHLAERSEFANIARMAGAIEYRLPGGQPMVLAILHEFVPHEGSLWDQLLYSIGAYFERALARADELAGLAAPAAAEHFDVVDRVPVIAVELMGRDLELARLLGERVAQLHLALAAESSEADFAPENFTDFYRRSLYQAISGQTNRALRLLRRRPAGIPDHARPLCDELVAAEPRIRESLRQFGQLRIRARRTRIHGDLHLGRIINTGKDLVILDFGADGSRSLGERRLKRSPLQDVASMMRSYHYAAEVALRGGGPGAVVREEDKPTLRRAADFWVQSVGSAFMHAYLRAAMNDSFLPKSREELVALLGALMLEKAAREVLHEFHFRPDWIDIPVRGMLRLITEQAPA